MFQEFKQFVLRGNVVDLAVGVVMGAAFATVVSGFTGAFITPVIALFGGKADFGDLAFHVGREVAANGRVVDPGTTFAYGRFIDTTISFIITAAVVFFFVVKPINHLMSRALREPPPDPTTKKCPECLSEIPIDARRCAFCAVEQAAA